MNRWFENLPVVSQKYGGKIILSFSMVLLSVLMLLLFQTIDRIICIFAMLFSFVGDIALNYTKLERSERTFIIGGISFITAHMFYCLAYLYKIIINDFNFFNSGVLISILFLLYLTIIFFIVSDRNSKLFKFGIIYLWLTGINYTTIFSYAFSAGSYEFIACIGGVLFLFSDVIIGLERFANLKSKLGRELVWWLYPIGQIIIIIFA